jgi:hypothetical protein
MKKYFLLLFLCSSSFAAHHNIINKAFQKIKKNHFSGETFLAIQKNADNDLGERKFLVILDQKKKKTLFSRSRFVKNFSLSKEKRKRLYYNFFVQFSLLCGQKYFSFNNFLLDFLEYDLRADISTGKSMRLILGQGFDAEKYFIPFFIRGMKEKYPIDYEKVSSYSKNVGSVFFNRILNPVFLFLNKNIRMMHGQNEHVNAFFDDMALKIKPFSHFFQDQEFVKALMLQSFVEYVYYLSQCSKKDHGETFRVFLKSLPLHEECILVAKDKASYQEIFEGFQKEPDYLLQVVDWSVVTNDKMKM